MTLERLEEIATRSGRFSDTQIIEWANRHDLKSSGSLTDLRCMFEDAASQTKAKEALDE